MRIKMIWFIGHRSASNSLIANDSESGWRCAWDAVRIPNITAFKTVLNDLFCTAANAGKLAGMDPRGYIGFEIAWLIVLALGASALIWALRHRAFNLRDDDASAIILDDRESSNEASASEVVRLSPLKKRITAVALMVIIGALLIAPIATVIWAKDSAAAQARALGKVSQP